MLDTKLHECNEICMAGAFRLKELCLLRENVLECMLDNDEIACLLNDVCVN